VGARLDIRKPLSVRMKEADPFLQNTAAGYASSFGRDEPSFVKDLLQVIREEALRVEDKFDPSTGSKFTTYLWPAITGAIIDYVKKDGRDGALLALLAKALAEVGPGAFVPAASDGADEAEPGAGEADGEAGRAFDLFEATEEEISKQFTDVKNRLMGSMVLSLLEVHPDPETEYLEAVERAHVAAKVQEALANYSESDHILIQRHAVEKEPLNKVLATTPPWDREPYLKGWRYWQRLRGELRDAFEALGLG
jgi:DNA-directed RNA polymerase specialized sigma24 family protein